MPIIFISLNETFIELVKKNGFHGELIQIQKYIPNTNKKTYYVSPANSLCFMDGGIDYALSRIIFPNIEKRVKQIVKELNIKNTLGQYYLPIGSSIIIDNLENLIDNDNKFTSSLVISPTMLLPHDVSNTKNAYYSTMAILYNVLINKKENLEEVDILFTSLCCGYGKMNETDSFNQIMDGIRDYKSYEPKIINDWFIYKEPNLHDQPKYYENSAWFHIKPQDIIKQ
jgi:O-acetyl-ADP-ribose deacetylase (regulator of RNase III)